MTNNLGHLMVDLETMSSDSNAVIIGVAAVEFDLKTGQTGRTFYETSSIQSCLDIGLTVTGKTIAWWLLQNEIARKQASEAKSNISDVLSKFRFFLAELNTHTTQIWGNSARFDLGILEDAYKKLKQDIPWNFRNERDVRTLVSFAPDIKANAINDGVAHNPLDDCRFQISYCTEIFNKLK
jgi:hypothetical protein